LVFAPLHVRAPPELIANETVLVKRAGQRRGKALRRRCPRPIQPPGVRQSQETGAPASGCILVRFLCALVCTPPAGSRISHDSPAAWVENNRDRRNCWGRTVLAPASTLDASFSERSSLRRHPRTASVLCAVG